MILKWVKASMNLKFIKFCNWTIILKLTSIVSTFQGNPISIIMHNHFFGLAAELWWMYPWWINRRTYTQFVDHLHTGFNLATLSLYMQYTLEIADAVFHIITLGHNYHRELCKWMLYATMYLCTECYIDNTDVEKSVMKMIVMQWRVS